mgnify:CR=1 FL=1
MGDESQTIRRGRKFDQVLAGARDIFLRDGFEGASVDDIARAAGVSKATLYSYFPDKRLLFMEVARAECLRAADEAEAMIDDDADVAETLRLAGEPARLGVYGFGAALPDWDYYIAFNMFTKKGNWENKDDTGGYGFQWDVLVKTSDNNRLVGLFEPANIQPMNGMIQAQAPYKNQTGGFAFEHRELDMNKGESRIVDLIKVRRNQDMIDFAKKFESYFWRTPQNNGTDPWGLPYWIVKNNTEGFNGGIQTGFSDVAALSPTTYPQWRNWTAQYTDPTSDDLIIKWEKACDYTDFEPPIETPSFNTGNKYGYYTTYSVYSATKQLLKAQNEDLGFELDPMTGKPVFRRVPVTWVPALDADTTNPVYGVNWGVFKMAVLPGWWRREHVEANTPGQPTVTTVYTNTTWNWLVRDRRLNFVLATNTTQPY